MICSHPMASNSRAPKGDFDQRQNPQAKPESKEKSPYQSLIYPYQFSDSQESLPSNTFRGVYSNMRKKTTSETREKGTEQEEIAVTKDIPKKRVYTSQEHDGVYSIKESKPLIGSPNKVWKAFISQQEQQEVEGIEDGEDGISEAFSESQSLQEVSQKVPIFQSQDRPEEGKEQRRKEQYEQAKRKKENEIQEFMQTIVSHAKKAYQEMRKLQEIIRANIQSILEKERRNQRILESIIETNEMISNCWANKPGR